MLADARGENGSVRHATYVSDPLHDLTMSAFHTRDNKLWKLVTDALAAGTLATGHLKQTLDFLVINFDETPSHVQKRLRSLAPSLTHGAEFFGQESAFSAAVEALSVASGAYDNDKSLDAILEMRRGDPEAFSKYVSIWPSPHRLAFLICMAFDGDSSVRSRAIYQLVRLPESSGMVPSEVSRILASAITEDDGCLLAYAVAQALGESTPVDFESVKELLAKHPSALVRRALNVPL